MSSRRFDTKSIPIYIAEDLPDLPDYSTINREFPQLPSGMNKEEECEHHLQRAICSGRIIPTPEVEYLADVIAYDKMYPPTYKRPRKLIHMQPFALEQDIPDYDMDSEDEKWITQQNGKLDITPLKFEEMMDRLEKGSGQTVISLQEAKGLLKEDDDLIIAIYDYWLNKRLNLQHPLIPTVKTEHHLGTVDSNPYVAFRKKTKKMQTRKTRKNDQALYEKMLKLKRDLMQAVTLLELVKRREKNKREYLHLTIEIYEKRYQLNDFNGQMLADATVLKASRLVFAPLFTNQFGVSHQNWSHKVSTKDEMVQRKENRQYKKRKHKAPSTIGRAPDLTVDGGTTDEDADHSTLPGWHGSAEELEAAEGRFVFRRKKSCLYHSPLSGGLGNWPWCSSDVGGRADPRYRFCPTSVNVPVRRFVGMSRRRVGRGGRIILDRISLSDEEILSDQDTDNQLNPAQELSNGSLSNKCRLQFSRSICCDRETLKLEEDNSEQSTIGSSRFRVY